MPTDIDDAADTLRIAGIKMAPHPTEPGYFVVDSASLWEVMRRATQRGRYPWGIWLKGARWSLHQGEDFPEALSLEHFRQQLYSRATKEGRTVKTSIDREARSIEFQFSPAK